MVEKYDRVEEVVEMGYACFVCNYQNQQWERCTNCGVALGDYITVEPYYLDYSLEPCNSVRDRLENTDSTRKDIYKTIVRELDEINMDLAPISIEHTTRRKTDMAMKFSTNMEKVPSVFLQRVKCASSSTPRRATSRFNLVHALDNVAEAMEDLTIEEEYSDY